MFGKTTDDMAQMLMAMQDEARIICRHDQYRMVKVMEEMMARNRLFDSIPDKQALAKESMDCRRSGRELDLTGRMRLDSAGGQTAGITGRW
jgi:hypothetical protein